MTINTTNCINSRTKLLYYFYCNRYKSIQQQIISAFQTVNVRVIGFNTVYVIVSAKESISARLL